MTSNFGVTLRKDSEKADDQKGTTRISMVGLGDTAGYTMQHYACWEKRRKGQF